MKKTTKKIDKIITGVIIGTAVASMIGLSQTKKGKEVTAEIKEKIKENSSEVKKKGSSFFSNLNDFSAKVSKVYGKGFLFFIKFFNKKDKEKGEK